MATYEWPQERFQFYGGGGLFVSPRYATVDIPTQPEFSEGSVAIGACMAGGVQRRGLFAELAFSIGTSSTDLVRMSPNGVIFSVGYRRTVWPR